MRWLDKRAQRRYSRQFAALWEYRHDAIAIAVHIREGLPGYNDDSQPFYCGGIHPAQPLDPEDWQHADLTPPDVLQQAAAEAGAVMLWLSHAETGHIATIYVVMAEKFKKTA